MLGQGPSTNIRSAGPKAVKLTRRKRNVGGAQSAPVSGRPSPGPPPHASTPPLPTAAADSDDEAAQYSPRKRPRISPAGDSAAGRPDTPSAARIRAALPHTPSTALTLQSQGPQASPAGKGVLKRHGAEPAEATPRSVRFAEGAKVRQADPAEEGKDSEDDDGAETPSKPRTRSSNPTPVKTPTGRHGATTPTSIANLRNRTPTHATVSLITRLGLNGTLSEAVQNKARSLYDRYQSRRSRGLNHLFPPIGFPEAGCIDLACQIVGENNEYLNELIAQSQLPTKGGAAGQRNLFKQHCAELLSYLDLPPASASRALGSPAADDGAVHLTPSDISALLNKLGLPEWRGDLEAVLDAYAESLSQGTEAARRRWTRGPAVVAGAVRALSVARGKNFTAAKVIQCLPPKGIHPSSKLVNQSFEQLQNEGKVARVLRAVQRAAERDQEAKKKGKGKEAADPAKAPAPEADSESSEDEAEEEQQPQPKRAPLATPSKHAAKAPKPLTDPRADPVQQRRAEKLKEQDGADAEEEEREDGGERVARFSKRRSEAAAEEGKGKEKEAKPSPGGTPTKRRRKNVFDRMKKERKWVSGVNPMIPHTELLDYENPNSRISKWNKMKERVVTVLAELEEIWVEQDGDGDEEAVTASEGEQMVE